MLTIANVQSAIEGTNYYSNTSSYALSGKQQQYQEWYGEAAKELGLKGNIDKDELYKILKGEINLKGEVIKLGRKIGVDEFNHDCGRDLTFAVPKSVSLQHNLEGGDARIKNALINASKNTLDYIQENFIYTRVTQNGQVHLEKTNNIVAGLFYENLNRDFEFHDHMHCVIGNMTKRADGKYRSIEFKEVFAHEIHLGKVFRMELGFELQKLGYEIELTDSEKHFFQLKGFDLDLAEHFSVRTQTIIAKAKTLNKNLNAQVRQLANLLTRNNNKKISQENLRDLTEDRIHDYSTQSGKKDIISRIYALTSSAKNKKISTSTSSNTRQIVGSAIKHLSERNSVFTKKDIVNQSIAIGKTNIQAIEKEIGRLLKKEYLLSGIGKHLPARFKNDVCYTTTHCLTREKAIISLMIEGQTACKAVTTKSKADLLLKETTLNEGQKRAAKLILTTKDAISAIQGYAGTGKTYTLSETRKIIEEINELATKQNPNHIPYKLVGLAPSGAAVKELQKVLGDENAKTLQGFTAKYNGYAEGRGTLEGKKQEALKYQNHIYVVDESSMVSSKLMHEYTTIANILNIKTILIGDNRQLLGAEEGNPFAQIQKEGANCVTMDEIVRQKNMIGKAISYSAYARDFKKIFEKIGTNIVDCSKIKEFETKHKVENGELSPEHLRNIKVSNSDTALTVAKLYMSFDENKRNKTLILAQSNKSKDLVNEFIREILIDKKILGQKHTKEILVNKNPTLSQKEYCYNYRKNDVILFNKFNRFYNIDKNEYFEVIGTNRNKNLLTLRSLSNENKTIEFNPSTSKSYTKHIELYNRIERDFRVNDKVIFTRKIEDPKNPIVNSTLGQIKDINEGSYKIEIEGKIHEFSQNSLTLQHLDYSYCRTTHKGQGATAETAIILTESWWDHLTNQRNLLVQVTRQQKDVFMVVDNKTAVIEKVLKNRGDKEGAIEFTESNNHNLAKETQLKKNIFSALGGDEDYKNYKIALKQSETSNTYFTDRQKPIYREEQIDNKLTNSKVINDNHSALHRVLSITDKSISKLEQKIKHETKTEKQANPNFSDKKYNQHVTKSKDYIIPDFSESEIKSKLKEEIYNKLSNSNLKDLDQAIDTSFTHLGQKAYFGEKKKGELCWYGSAGYFKDYKTGDFFKWGKGNIKLTEEEKKRFKNHKVSSKDLKIIQKEQELKVRQEKIAQQLKYEKAAQSAQKTVSELSEKDRLSMGKHHPYLIKKGILGAHRIKEIGFRNNNIIIPIKNINGKIVSYQYIKPHKEEGQSDKGFLKGGAKNGNFCIIGEDKLNNTKKIYLAEGFATAASIYAATQSPVVICFDAGNISPVLKQFKEKYPEKIHIIAADNDKWSKNTNSKITANVGLEAAQKAAKQYDAKVVTPQFNKQDIEKFQKQHGYTKHPTDFNDLHQIRNLQTVSSQLSHHNERTKQVDSSQKAIISMDISK